LITEDTIVLRYSTSNFIKVKVCGAILSLAFSKHLLYK